MDLSKLPKLSDSQSQVPPPVAIPVEPENTPANARPDYRPGDRQPGPGIGVGVDIWISVIIGLLLLMMGARFGKWAVATLRHQPYHTEVNWTDGPKTGSEVSYFELEGFTALSEMGIFLFGAMLLAEAAAKFLTVIKPGNISRAFLMFATLLTLAAVLLNIYAAYKLFTINTIPFLSGLAVAFGGWILLDEITTLQRTAAPPRR